MITVACVWVKANVNYRVEYVYNLRSMVRRHLRRPHRFVCLTERPHFLKGVETIRIPSPRPLSGWWSKVQLFNVAHQLTGRVLYLDLDTLVARDLSPIVDFPAPFALVPHAGSFEGKNGRTVVKKYNSSVMVWDEAVPRLVFERWSPSVAKRLWGDQDWIGELMPDAATFPEAWCPRLSTMGEPPFPEDTKVILSKKPKNHVAAAQWSWFDVMWRRP